MRITKIWDVSSSPFLLIQLHCVSVRRTPTTFRGKIPMRSPPGTYGRSSPTTTEFWSNHPQTNSWAGKRGQHICASLPRALRKPDRWITKKPRSVLNLEHTQIAPVNPRIWTRNTWGSFRKEWSLCWRQAEQFQDEEGPAVLRGQVPCCSQERRSGHASVGCSENPAPMAPPAPECGQGCRVAWVLLHALGMLTTAQRVHHVLHRNGSGHSGFINGHMKAVLQAYHRKPGSYTKHMGVRKDAAAAQKLQNRCTVFSIASAGYLLRFWTTMRL